MALRNASVVTTPTSIVVSGGTALAFSDLGSSEKGLVKLYVAADGYSVRRTIDAKVSVPKVSASSPGGWSQARSSGVYKKPKVLSNGKTTINTISVAIAFDPETTDAEKQELLDIGAQMIIDADFQSFWKAQSQA